MAKSDSQTLVSFVVRHVATGLAAGALFGGAILVSNFADLRQLIFNSDSPWLALFLLFFGLFITFGSVSLAANIMLLKRDDRDH